MIITPDFTTPTGRPSKVRHGDRSAYTGYGCRCPECTKTNADYYRALRTARSASDPRITHGTPSAYRNYNCRCDDCRAAGTESHRAWRKSHKFNVDLAARS